MKKKRWQSSNYFKYNVYGRKIISRGFIKMYYGSATYLIYYFSKKIIKYVLQLKLSEEQIFLREITGKTFFKEDAAHLWKKINDHKWYLGELLGRDIGLGAATLDYLENFTSKNHVANECENSSDLSANLYDSFA